MAVAKARHAWARVMIVPLVMSALLWVVVGELVLRAWWPAMPLVIVPVLALAANTRAGERCLAAVFMRARAPRLHQRHTLAPVAAILLDHGATSEHLILLVGHRRDNDVCAVGRRIVVVSAGLIESVRLGRMSPVAGAAVIAHELGVQRAGLTRRDPSVRVVLAPWTVWLTFIGFMWGVAAAFLPHRLIVACLAINAGVGIWLGLTADPAMFVSTAFWAVVAWTWWTFQSWIRARAQIGDAYLVQVGLAGVYAQVLVNSFTDDYTRDRAVRLWHPERSVAQADVPGAVLGAPVALSTTGR